MTTLRSRRRKAPRDEISEVRLGMILTLVVALAVGVTTVIYLHPPGRKTVAFSTTDVSAINTGQDVRIAGVSVGEVAALTLGTDTVTVEMSIDDEVFVGAESSIEVRMLTPVGGYAVTLNSIGDVPLGENTIGSGRVTVPYSIGDVLQAAPNVTDEVRGDTVDANLAQVADALTAQPDSVESMISGLTAITRVMDQQRTQVESIADLAAEYLGSFDADRELVFGLIRDMDMVFSTYDTHSAGFNDAYIQLGNVLMSLASVEKYYFGHKEEVTAAVVQVRTLIEQFDQSMGPAMDALAGAREQLAKWLTPDGLAAVRGGALMSSDICAPVPGRTC